jgi:dienelactone hydrolase
VVRAARIARGNVHEVTELKVRRALGLACCALVLLGCDDAGRREAQPATGPASSPPPPADCGQAVSSIVDGFGAPGPHAPARTSFDAPGWPGQRVSLFLPRGATGPRPVVVLAHANGVDDPVHYRGLIEHVVSRGHAVVFPAYMIGGHDLPSRYDVLLAGLLEALRRHPGRLDASRIGFVGHSFGAGALPWLARRALVELGLGGRGAFLLAMAPWYALRTTSDDLRGLPAHLAALVLVFEDDRVTDHRIAIELFQAIGVPDDRKDYLVVRSDREGDCSLEARHTVPQSSGLAARDDALDVHAVFRLFDALAAFAFDGDEAGRRTALGHGSESQVTMGRWRSGRPVLPLLWRRRPEPLRPPDRYLFALDDAAQWKGEGGEISRRGAGPVP